MRFTLSEVPAVVPPSGGQPDGRGPHPLSAQKSFKYGETEDFLHFPPPPGELGQLVLENRVIAASEPEPYHAQVSYEIQLTNVGGTGPAQAFIRDVLPSSVTTPAAEVNWLIKVTSPGGVRPLVANGGMQLDEDGKPSTTIDWDGTLDPDSSVTLTFPAVLAPSCKLWENQQTIVSEAQAGGDGVEDVTATSSVLTQCGGLKPYPVDPSTLPSPL